MSRMLAVAAVAVLGVVGQGSPARAYWPGYYGYGPRVVFAPPVYYRPYYPPPVVLLPPPAPVYFAPPPYVPGYAAPSPRTAPRPVRRARAAAPRPCTTCASPFTGPGMMPAAESRPVPQIAPAVPAPPSPAGPPPNNLYPPERGFAPFTGD